MNKYEQLQEYKSRSILRRTRRAYDDDKLSGETGLLVAMLHRVIEDARSKALEPKRVTDREDAQAWLRDQANVTWICDLLGLDDTRVWHLMLREAGMEIAV